MTLYCFISCNFCILRNMRAEFIMFPTFQIETDFLTLKSTTRSNLGQNIWNLESLNWCTSTDSLVLYRIQIFTYHKKESIYNIENNSKIVFIYTKLTCNNITMTISLYNCFQSKNSINKWGTNKANSIFERFISNIITLFVKNSHTKRIFYVLNILSHKHNRVKTYAVVHVKENTFFIHHPFVELGNLQVCIKLKCKNDIVRVHYHIWEYWYYINICVFT